MSNYRKSKKKNFFLNRAGIEPVTGHLKAGYRLSHNFYKGCYGDNIYVMLAASGFSFKRVMNKLKASFWFFFHRHLTFMRTILDINFAKNMTGIEVI